MSYKRSLGKSYRNTFSMKPAVAATLNISTLHTVYMQDTKALWWMNRGTSEWQETLTRQQNTSAFTQT